MWRRNNGTAMTRAETAKRLNCSLRIGKYGFKLYGHKLGGGRKLISMTTLDGWIFNPKEIENAMRLDDTWKLAQQDTRSTKAKKGVQKNATTHYREEG
jgi:hypothetical protein